MTMPYLDIITITKDDLEGVSGTIKSTELLRFRDGVRQIIVDSSCSEIGAKIKELVSGEKNIDYIWQAPSGISAAFNLGLSLSKAEWVWFLNGGDEVHPDAEPEKLLYLIKQSRSDAIIFEIELMQSGERLRHPRMWSMWPPLFAWIPHPATLTRRYLYEKYGNFNESLKIAMDYEFWIRCFSKDVTVDMISIPIVKFDTKGMSYSRTAQVSREAVSIIKSHLWEMIKIWLKNGLLIVRALFHFSKKSKGG
jgi:glycosyltransferase involved in cell wall biosynthesis